MNRITQLVIKLAAEGDIDSAGANMIVRAVAFANKHMTKFYSDTRTFEYLLETNDSDELNLDTIVSRDEVIDVNDHSVLDDHPPCSYGPSTKY